MSAAPPLRIEVHPTSLTTAVTNELGVIDAD
jgi:hypothetical protein